MTTPKTRPAHEIRLGCVKAAIWANQSQKSGIWFCVTFTRLYKANGQWKRTSGFGVHELPQINKLTDLATQWIQRASTRAPAAAAEPPVQQPLV